MYQSATDMKCLIFWFEMINRDQWVTLGYLWGLSLRLHTHVFLGSKGFGDPLPFIMWVLRDYSG